MTRGRIAGGEERGRAARLAGALAEMGVQSLTLTAPGGGCRRLSARKTDLPGVLAAAPDGSGLESQSPRLRVVIRREALEWESDDPAAAQALGGA
jgi:hypothetical protein